MPKDIFIYPAIFMYEDDGISIEFPDIPEAISCAHNDSDAVKNAKDVLALILSDMEDDERDIPSPSPISSIKLSPNQVICMIEVWMPYYRALIKTAYIKKTLTIPNWLNILAEHHKINFSATLQEALKQKLGVVSIHSPTRESDHK